MCNEESRFGGEPDNFPCLELHFVTSDKHQHRSTSHPVSHVGEQTGKENHVTVTELLKFHNKITLESDSIV